MPALHRTRRGVPQRSARVAREPKEEAMTETQLPDLKTPVAPAELYAALRRAWPAIVQDTLVTRPALLVLCGQWAFETGWGHACHRYNLGNAKHVPGDGHEWCEFPCTEVINGTVITIDPPHPGCQFIAFETLDEACIYYLTSLRGRWRAAWPYALAGDAAGFCHQLKLQGYYTDDEHHYTLSVQSCSASIDHVIPPDPSAADVAHAALADAALKRDPLHDDLDPPPDVA